MALKLGTAYTDLSKAATKVAEAHQGIKDAIAQHAEQAAIARQEAHTKLTADNQLKAV